MPQAGHIRHKRAPPGRNPARPCMVLPSSGAVVPPSTPPELFIFFCSRRRALGALLQRAKRRSLHRSGSPCGSLRDQVSCFARNLPSDAIATWPLSPAGPTDVTLRAVLGRGPTAGAGASPAVGAWFSLIRCVDRLWAAESVRVRAALNGCRPGSAVVPGGGRHSVTVGCAVLSVVVVRVRCRRGGRGRTCSGGRLGRCPVRCR